jgi:ParB/RepB/Spo0J family partition protein
MTVKEQKLRRVKTEDIVIVKGRNPRVVNEKSAGFLELVESVAAQGVIVPVHVRAVGETFELLAGERRVLAARAAGNETVPAVDHGEISDAEAFEITFAENFAREDLTPIEQGRAAKLMLERYDGDAEAAASKLGKTVRWVMQRARLATELSEKWLDFSNGEGYYDDALGYKWTASHLQIVAALPKDVQDELLENSGLTWGDVPSVKELEAIVAGRFNYLDKAPWNTTKAGCGRCNKRSAKQPGLFDDTTDKETVKKNDRCLDQKCWGEKMTVHLKEKMVEAAKDHPNIIAAVMPGENWEIKRDLAKEYGGICSEWKSSKAGAKGAVPAMIVHGPTAGDVLWIRPAGPQGAGGKRTTGPQGAGGQTTDDGRQDGKPTPLKERRERLDKKRWNQVLVNLREKLNEIEFEIVADKFRSVFFDQYAGVVMLAAQYGVGEMNNGSTFEDRREVVVKVMAAKDGMKTAIGFLWNRVAARLADKLAYNGPVTQTPDSKIEWAKYVAEIIGVDIDAMFAEVSKEKGFTEPKSWAK